MPVHELPCPAPFDLRLALHGHGWVSLEPHRWIAREAIFETVLCTEVGATDVQLRQEGERVLLSCSSAKPRAVDVPRAQLSHMLRLDEDFAPFWRLCRREPSLRWVAKRGAGRMLRSVTVFEDLMKLLFTTNCSWAATQRMTERLVSALGEVAPSGRRAFPTPARCAQAGEQFFRDEVRAGYRSGRAVALARLFAEGRLDDSAFRDVSIPTEVLRVRLLALPGFGPYAAGQALRLLGRYDDLALDSWCRSKLASLEGRRKPRSDRAIEKTYERYGAYRGLVMWMQLTADWHLPPKKRGSSALSPSALKE